MRYDIITDQNEMVQLFKEDQELSPLVDNVISHTRIRSYDLDNGRYFVYRESEHKLEILLVENELMTKIGELSIKSNNFFHYNNYDLIPEFLKNKIRGNFNE